MQLLFIEIKIMADTPVKTVRTVHLIQRDGQFFWLCEDDTTVYGPAFPTESEAKAWLFTPVVVEAEAKEEAP